MDPLGRQGRRPSVRGAVDEARARAGFRVEPGGGLNPGGPSRRWRHPEFS
jgi:hypothetical protein